MQSNPLQLKNSKSILIIGPSWPLRGGGISTFNQVLAQRLMDEGHTVKILTFKLQYPSFLFPGKSQWSDEEKPADLDITVGLNSINPFNWLIQGFKFRKNKYDLVIMRYWLPFMGPCLGTVARLIKWRSNTRVVAITDNVIPHEKRFGDALFTKYFVGSCDGFVAMSRAVLKDLEGFDGYKPKKFNPHPMYDNFGKAISKEEALAKLDLDPSLNYMLFFGFIRKYKGLKLLLESLIHLDLEAMKLKLIIAGEFYDQREEYDAFIQEHQLEKHLVRVHNFIPDAEVGTYFCASDLVVQTYLHATQSGVTQIAYFYNKPMLVTDVGGLAELVPHQKTGYVCAVDAKDVAASIQDFYSNKREAAMIENITIERLRFSWSGLIESLWEVSVKKK
ncbi:MAG: D-inositol-3-phosphate glycosyltransferase [Bacteroidia bacterium]